MSVQVLLSTYNGELYLRALLDSLLIQDYPYLSILIRDDGSADNTPALLREYALASNNIEIARAGHLGFVESFLTLIALASPTADYFALCDQDDIWQSDKVSQAVRSLSSYPRDIPVLYCSRLAIVDENLTPLGFSAIPRRPISFCNALVECQARGCTLLFNRAARQLLLRELPKHACSHDMWISLVASAFGTIIYDPEPKILYRKHAGNTVGISLGVKDTWAVKLTQFLKDRRLHLVVKQAEEFSRIYGSSLTDEHRRVIERFLESRKTFWDRLRYAMSCDVYRQATIDQYILKARIALDCL